MPAALIDLPRFADARGALSWASEAEALGFAPFRAYWLTGWTPGVARGVHAHRRLRQLYVALAGTVTVEVEDAAGTARFVLDRPDRGLLLGPMTFRSLQADRADTVLLALADGPHDEAEIQRDRDLFRRELSR